jgi:formamidopyrimidine-DNA glycosylase
MPELPEVETVVRQLAPRVIGRRVRSLKIYDPKLRVNQPQSVAGRVIGAIERIGKQILMRLDDEDSRGNLWWCVHLRMTGRLIWSSEPGPEIPPLRARLALDGGHILFKDVRRFGTMRLIKSIGELPPGGMDPLSPSFTPAALGQLLAGSRQEIKPWLLRQDRLAGVGNIYASEALFAARIHPRRLASALDSTQIRRLHHAILTILRQGIKHGGTTVSDFENARGESGGFQKRLAVYGRAGQPCRRCGAPVARIAQQSRGTFFCLNCQD